jgi:hypothetical protein
MFTGRREMFRGKAGRCACARNVARPPVHLAPDWNTVHKRGRQHLRRRIVTIEKELGQERLLPVAQIPVRHVPTAGRRRLHRADHSPSDST